MDAQTSYEELAVNIISQAKLKCKACGGKAKLRKRAGRPIVGCCWRLCNKRISLWGSTVFKSRIWPVSVQLAILDAWIIGMRPQHIARFFRIKVRGLYRFFNRVIPVLVRKFYASIPKIGGDGVVVEIDESKFGKRKYNRGHHVDGVWVFGMVERTEERRIILVSVPNRSAETLTQLAQRYIEQSSTIYSDMWRGYASFKSYFHEHLTVNHSIEFVSSTNGVHTNSIEGNWAGLKTETPVRGRTRRLIDRYLVRFMLKRNHAGFELETVIKLLLL